MLRLTFGLFIALTLFMIISTFLNNNKRTLVKLALMNYHINWCVTFSKNYFGVAALLEFLVMDCLFARLTLL